MLVAYLFTLITTAFALTHKDHDHDRDSKPKPDSRVTPKVLAYYRAIANATHGYRHPSIPHATASLAKNGPKYGFSMDISEDPTLFVDGTLKKYDAIMFVLSSEEILDIDQQAALKRYWQSGGVFVGVHSASAALWKDDDFYKQVGGHLWYHPLLQKTTTFVPLTRKHPAMVNVPKRWTIEEEAYYYRDDPRKMGHKILMTVDESSYKNIDQAIVPGQPAPNTVYPPVEPHPIAWCNERPLGSFPLFKGVKKPGRSFYTTLGHSNSTWADPIYLDHLFGGLRWALDGASTRAYAAGLVGNAEKCKGSKCKDH